MSTVLLLSPRACQLENRATLGLAKTFSCCTHHLYTAALDSQHRGLADVPRMSPHRPCTTVSRDIFAHAAHTTTMVHPACPPFSSDLKNLLSFHRAEATRVCASTGRANLCQSHWDGGACVWRRCLWLTGILDGIPDIVAVCPIPPCELRRGACPCHVLTGAI